MASALQLLLAMGLMMPCVGMAWRRRHSPRRWLWRAAAVMLPLCAVWAGPMDVGLALVDGRLMGGICAAPSTQFQN